jgi:hypothetical protein
MRKDTAFLLFMTIINLILFIWVSLQKFGTL